MNPIDVAVVGATGAVGEVVVELLAKRNFPVKQLHLLASERTAGTSLLFNGSSVMVHDLKGFDFALVKLAIFVATDAVSAEYLPKAQAAGCLVIDNSQVFAESAPLIVPSVNAAIFAANPTLIVNPDSNALLLATVLKPLLERVDIEHVGVTAFQSVSGSGKKAIHELASQAASLLNGRGAESKVFPKQIAFNVLPTVGDEGDHGYSKAEHRLVEQTRRLLGDDSFSISGHCVQVPVFYSDGLLIDISCHGPLPIDTVASIFNNHNELTLVSGDDPNEYATAVSEATGSESIFISRLRANLTRDTGLNFWLVADNVRKSAAFNTILIAEELIKSYL